MLNNGQKIDLPIGNADLGHSLASYLERHAAWFRGFDCDSALAEGRFTMDELPLGRDDLLDAKKRLNLFRKPWQEPDIPTDIPVLYRDDDVLVVDKPHGIPITPTGLYYEHSLLHLLRKQFAEPDLSPAHRLDTGTAGVLLLTRTKAVRGFYQTQFQRNEVDKRYVALVRGHLDPSLMVIDFPLVRDSQIYTKFVAGAGGCSARTEILAVEHVGPNSLVTLKPITGRTNQIRAHLAAVGHPIVGDLKYGADPQRFLDAAGLAEPKLTQGFALQCQHLGVKVGQGKNMIFESQRGIWAEGPFARGVSR